MSGYHGSKFSGSQQFFSAEIAICIGKQWSIVKAIVHKKIMHFDVLFFPAIFAGPKFDEIQKFCYHGNVT